ncbi:MAG: hypothetical protein ACO1RT_10195 [Planctomycetaceae bacterium]
MADTSSAAMPQRAAKSRTRQLLARAMADPDRLAIRIEYVDVDGMITRRPISPIRFVGRDRDQVLALCLSREEPRNFIIEQVRFIEVINAASLLMPIEIEELSE